jgi:hypothetical protein
MDSGIAGHDPAGGGLEGRIRGARTAVGRPFDAGVTERRARLGDAPWAVPGDERHRPRVLATLRGAAMLNGRGTLCMQP